MAGVTPEVPSVFQQFQMPNAFDQTPMQQMSAMMAMAAAAGVAGGAGAPFMPPAPAAPQAGDGTMASLFPPGVDPAMAQVAGQAGFEAYAQWVSQYLQQAQAAYVCGNDPSGMGGGMGVPPSPFAGMGTAPYAPSMPAAPVVAVSVDGMKFQYQLTEDDLHKVFSRYGAVNHIHVDEVGTTAQITFKDFHTAQAAMTDLNGKVLNGLEGTLRLVWANEGPASMPPYPIVPPFPNWGFPMPGAPSWPGAATPGAPGAAGTAPTGELPGGFGGFAPAADLANILALGAPGVSTPPAAGDASVAASPGTEAVGPSGSAATPGASTDAKAATAPAHVKGVRKYTCRFLIGIENDKEFQVVRRIIGAKGTNMKRIVRQTEAKLRLRGVGSGYFEGAGQRESSEPLQLCVSCTSYDGYRNAVRLVEELLETVYNEYRQFCRENGKPEPELHASPQLVSAGGRSGASGGGFPLELHAGGGGAGPGSGGSDSGAGEPNTAAASGAAEGESPSGKRDGGRRRGRRSRAKKGDASKSGVERGDPPPKAPPVEEIERFIDARNEARRQCNFIEADRIRQSLHEKGVALMDEPGARGKGAEVTTWRYWRE